MNDDRPTGIEVGPGKPPINPWGRAGKLGMGRRSFITTLREKTNELDDIADFLVQVVRGEVRATARDRIEASKLIIDRVAGKAVETHANLNVDATEFMTHFGELGSGDLKKLARAALQNVLPPEGANSQAADVTVEGEQVGVMTRLPGPDDSE